MRVRIILWNCENFMRCTHIFFTKFTNVLWVFYGVANNFTNVKLRMFYKATKILRGLQFYKITKTGVKWLCKIYEIAKIFYEITKNLYEVYEKKSYEITNKLHTPNSKKKQKFISNTITTTLLKTPHPPLSPHYNSPTYFSTLAS